MKRIVPLLLAAVILLSGCGSAGSTAAGDLDMDKIAAAAAPKLGVSNAVEGTGVYPQWDEGNDILDAASLEPSYGADFVFMTVTQQQSSAKTSSGTTAFTCQYDEVAVESRRYPDQAQRISDQLGVYLRRRQEQTDRQEDEALEACRDADDAGEAFYSWSSFCDVTAQRIDDAYVSVVAYNSVYLGGAHSDSDQAAMNFDLASGSLMSLSSIFKTKYKEQILDKLLHELSELESSFMLFDGYEATVREKFEQMPADMTQNWYLTDRGVVFFYNPYEISPYASGVVSVELSYAELVGYLRDDFVWPSRDQKEENALLAVTQTDGIKRGDDDRVVTLDLGSGSELTITAEGEIRNLRVELVQLAGDNVVSSNLLLAANRFTDQEALLLELPGDGASGTSTAGLRLRYDIAYRETITQVYSIGPDGVTLVEQANNN